MDKVRKAVQALSLTQKQRDDLFNKISKTSINGGGGEPNTSITIVQEIKEKDVNFYDYDGTRLYSYTWDEFTQLTKLPPLPEREGLICQEWNYSLEDIREQDGYCDVGATYITDDGRTRIYVDIPLANEKLNIVFNQIADNNVIINWGDGTEETYVGTKDVVSTHTYNRSGKYVVQLWSVDDSEYFLGYEDNTKPITTNRTIIQNEFFESINLGKGITKLPYSAFYGLSIKTITIPNNIKHIDEDVFFEEYKLKALIIPKGITELMDYVFNLCGNLQILSIPNTIITISRYVYDSLYSIKSIIIPKSVTSFIQIDYCYNVNKLIINGTGDVKLRNMNTISIFRINKNIQDIQTNDVRFIKYLLVPVIESMSRYNYFNMTRILIMDFRNYTVVPPINEVPDFRTLGYFVVPDNLYEEWTNATNWGNIAEQIIKVSDYDAIKDL